MKWQQTQHLCFIPAELRKSGYRIGSWQKLSRTEPPKQTANTASQSNARSIDKRTGLLQAHARGRLCNDPAGGLLALLHSGRRGKIGL